MSKSLSKIWQTLSSSGFTSLSTSLTAYVVWLTAAAIFPTISQSLSCQWSSNAFWIFLSLKSSQTFHKTFKSDLFDQLIQQASMKWMRGQSFFLVLPLISLQFLLLLIYWCSQTEVPLGLHSSVYSESFFLTPPSSEEFVMAEILFVASISQLSMFCKKIQFSHWETFVHSVENAKARLVFCRPMEIDSDFTASHTASKRPIISIRFGASDLSFVITL